MIDKTTWIADLLILLSGGFVAGVICKKFHFSTLVGYLIAGAVIGQGGLRWVSGGTEQIEAIAHFGVLLLLFSIGLEFSLDELNRFLKFLLVAGGVFMVISITAATLLLSFTGVEIHTAFLLSAAMSLSSTVLVFKALSEWGRTATPSGQRAMGILLFQDIALVPLLLAIPLLTGRGESSQPFTVLLILLKSGALVIGVHICRKGLNRWIVPMLANLRSTELVVLLVLTMLTGLAYTAHLLGLPAPLGALAAGIVFNGNRLSSQVDALILPFRESFSAVFFVSLGLLLESQTLLGGIHILVPELLVVLLLKTTAGAIALRITGLPWKASIGMGAGLSQMGELSFVLVMNGVQAGLLSLEDYNRFLCLAVGSLVLTPLLLQWGLNWTHQGDETEGREYRRSSIPSPSGKIVGIIGLGPIGRRVFSQLEIMAYEVILIDRSPVNLHPFAQQGFLSIEGDATDSDVLKRAQVETWGFAIVCVPDDLTAIQVIRTLKELNNECLVFARCRYLANTGLLKKAGADHVITDEKETSEVFVKELTAHERL